jgi:nicotinate-nucleotide adenylyltransferase
VRIGILGGTFDPIHLGHLAAAHVAMECAQLDRVLFIPSATPPHREPAVADPKQRLEMSARAIDGETRFAVSDVEIKRGGRSYTADTIEELGRSYPGDELFLILGWDAARLFSTWERPDVIRKLARVVVVRRPGTSAPRTTELKAAGLDPKGTVLCEGRTPDISASDLRQAIAGGRPTEDRLPEGVRRYIAEHRLYRDNR